MFASSIDNFHIALIVAIVLFCVSGVLRFTTRSFDSALVSFGLAALALAFIINS